MSLDTEVAAILAEISRRASDDPPIIEQVASALNPSARATYEPTLTAMLTEVVPA